MNIEESKSYGSAVLYGVIAIFIVALISSLIFSLLLRFTSIDEAALKFPITTVSFITLFVGGFISGKRRKEKGWFLGGLTGFVYSFIIFLFHYLGFGKLFSFDEMVYHICFFLTAMMGGILGVNTSSKSRSI
ncbi:TIGR04086 family membrane protein [Bacillus sp. 03113]|uniref:TIGR04086 family membrane protein n=1 Tax=Bacillus sp. 03113 TaxID=2578211 RepID=UPI002852F247|nr:TIGR04086 family membrane protein [Bacillus sp. 03113]